MDKFDVITGRIIPKLSNSLVNSIRGDFLILLVPQLLQNSLSKFRHSDYRTVWCVIDVYFCPVDQHFRVILLVNSARTVFGDKLHFGLSWAKCHIVVRL
jgi:hypothetical protein